MKIEAYLRVVSDEATIQALHAESGVSHASVRRLQAVKDANRGEMWWQWATNRISIDIFNTDEGLRALLEERRAIFPIIKRYSVRADVYLEVVAQYAPGEEPQGLFLSKETINLLNEIGGALDVDVVIHADARDLP